MVLVTIIVEAVLVTVVLGAIVVVLGAIMIAAIDGAASKVEMDPEDLEEHLAVVVMGSAGE